MEHSLINVQFGKKIRELRIQKGLTQEELADLVGIHTNYVILIELAKYNVSLKVIGKLAAVFEVELKDLFNDEIFSLKTLELEK